MADKKYTTCEQCNQEMAPGVSCEKAVYMACGTMYDPIQYDSVIDLGVEGLNCPDCNAPNGGFHHPGCDQEICAHCGNQIISCDCVGLTTSQN